MSIETLPNRILIQDNYGRISFDTNWRMARFFYEGYQTVNLPAVDSTVGVFNDDFLILDIGVTMDFVAGYMMYGSTFYPLNGGTIPIASVIASAPQVGFPVFFVNFSIYASGTQVRLRRQIYKSGLSGINAFNVGVRFYAGRYDL